MTTDLPAPSSSAEPPTGRVAHLGDRVRLIRESLGKTREEMAPRAGMSADYLKQIENGRRRVQRVGTIVDLAAALGVKDLGILIGQRWTTGSPVDERIHPATDAIAALIRSPLALAPASDAQVPSVDDLQAEVDHQWREWHGTGDPYSRLAVPLPRLLVNIETCLSRMSPSAQQEAAHRRRAQAVRSQAWTLARQWLRETQQNELAGIAADRALAAAVEADSPMLIAFSAWNVIGVHNAQGLWEEADEVASRTLEMLAGLPDPARTARVRGMGGALELYRSIALAHLDDEDAALRAFGRADEVSRSLGSGYMDDWTCFGAANVAFYSVGIQVELGKEQRAAELARRVNAGDCPSRQRQGRYLIDVSRAHCGRGEDDAGLAVMLQAEKAAPEQVAYSWYAQQEVLGMLHRYRVTDRAALTGLASRLGLVS